MAFQESQFDENLTFQRTNYCLLVQSRGRTPDHKISSLREADSVENILPTTCGSGQLAAVMPSGLKRPPFEPAAGGFSGQARGSGSAAAGLRHD